MKNPDCVMVPGPNGTAVADGSYTDPPGEDAPTGGFSILRMLIVVAIIAVWMGATKLTYEHAPLRPPEEQRLVVSAIMGVMLTFIAMLLFFATLALAGEIEKVLKGDWSSWSSDGEEEDGDEEETP